MAMMGSTAWNGQEHALHPGADEDFQQFLDMNSMSSLADGLHFEFPEFQNNGPEPHMLAQARDSIDTPMTGGETVSSILSRPVNVNVHGSIPGHPAAASAARPSIPAAMMPPPTPTEAISDIDAQIQYLQQQRLQQQHRQIEEQSISFFTRQNQIVPPTPQSLELQAGNQFFSSPDPHPHRHHHQHHNQQQAIYERYQHLKEQQDMSFTPLVSPAVTPLESHFSIDSQFTMPGAYFSPLTSPALLAQNDPVAAFDPRLATTGTSPLDMGLDSLSGPAPVASSGMSASGDLARKLRKNNASAKTKKSNVRQSPITKPQRKKTTTTPTMNAQVLDQLAESLENGGLSSPAIQQQGGQYFPPHAHLTAAAMLLGPSSSSMGATDSENGSVSPENLNSTDMPPPPIPKSRSGRPSPYLHPQNDSHAGVQARRTVSAISALGAPTAMAVSAAPSHISLSGGFPSPATPASLMRLASPQQKSHKSASNAGSTHGTPGSNVLGSTDAAANMATDYIENFELPESLSMDFQKPPMSSLSVHSTPMLHTTASPSIDPLAATASGFQPLPSPIFAKPGNALAPAPLATHSPQLMPGGNGGPTSAAGSTPQMLAQSQRKTPQMLPRGSKKRASISSVHVSPALLPRISPVIKPLLPGGVSSVEDQASRLLATKSNYQNILEGNTVPGVSYPSELSTNLTSKRTSHKIAEQGRRNRINTALQEIATLLPQPPKEGRGGSDGDNDMDDGEAGGKKDKDGKGGGNGPNSKASTVELAIEYIKQLKQELAEATQRAEVAEKKLQERGLDVGGACVADSAMATTTTEAADEAVAPEAVDADTVVVMTD